MKRSMLAGLAPLFLSGVLALSAGACAPEAPRANRWVEMDLALGPDGLRVVSAARAPSTNPPVDGAYLTWTLFGADGRVIATDRVRDTREVRFEDLSGTGGHDTLPSDVGVITLRLPPVAGTLVLEDASGLDVGRLTITDGEQRTSQLALLARGDVLGAAQQIRGGSADEGLDILFLPEGYTEVELAAFHADVESVVDALAAQPDYAALWDHIRVFRRDVRSRTSGVGSGGEPVDTAFDIAFGHAGTDRCAWFATAEGRAAAERLRAESRADAVAILVNSRTYGGCGSDGLSVNAMTSPRETAQVVAHELGHAFFGLADEYETANPAIDDCEGSLPRDEVNVTDSATDLPWADLVDGSGVVGAFEGAHYCTHGRYRPAHDCLMRNLYQRMCPVCSRHMARVVGVAWTGSTGSGSGSTGSGSTGSGGGGAPTSVELVNRTGAELWARCAGTESRICNGWVLLLPGESKRVASFDRRIVLDNRDALPAARLAAYTFTAVTERVDIYANASDPLTPPSASGVPGSGGPGAGEDPPSDEDPDPGSAEVITSLTPTIRDTSISGDALTVTWDRVVGGPDYWVYAMAMTSSTEWAGYTVETVADPDVGTTVSVSMSVAVLCSEAGSGDHGLAVQVMLAGDTSSAVTEWVVPVGGLPCD